MRLLMIWVVSLFSKFLEERIAQKCESMKAGWRDDLDGVDESDSRVALSH